MTIEIGKTKITVTLDATDAKADLEKIKAELKNQEKSAKTVAQKIGRAPAGTGAVESTTGGTGKASSNIAARLARLAADRLQGANVASGAIASIAGGRAVQAVAGSSSAVMGAAKVAGVAAATYGIISEGTKLASLYTEFLTNVLPNSEWAKTINTILRASRDEFVKLESKVVSALAAIKAAANVSLGAAAATGTTGSYTFYYDLERRAGDANRNLENKFEDFRRRKIAQALGNNLRDGTRRAFSK